MKKKENAGREVAEGLGLTVSAVEFHGVGRQLNRNSTFGRLWKLKILHLPICAEHVDIED